MKLRLTDCCVLQMISILPSYYHKSLTLSLKIQKMAESSFWINMFGIYPLPFFLLSPPSSPLPVVLMQYDIEHALNTALRFRALMNKLFSCLISIYITQRNLVEQCLHSGDRCFCNLLLDMLSISFTFTDSGICQKYVCYIFYFSCFCIFILVLQRVVVVYLLDLLPSPPLISYHRENLSLLQLYDTSSTRVSFSACINFINVMLYVSMYTPPF